VSAYALLVAAHSLHCSLCFGVAEAKAYKLLLTDFDAAKNSSVLAFLANALSVGVRQCVVLMERFGHCQHISVNLETLVLSMGRTNRTYQFKLSHLL
jgi:hypothetical protein